MAKKSAAATPAPESDDVETSAPSAPATSDNIVHEAKDDVVEMPVSIAKEPVYLARGQMIALDEISPSPTNPRVDYGDMNELIASIKSAGGVLQPVLVRPKGVAKGGGWELVYGHRRYKGALGAGMTAIPCDVRELDDDEVLELQVVENLQRKDVHPLEEAKGFAHLSGQSHLTAAEIAKRVGKSKAYVHASLKLNALKEPSLVEAFLKNEIPASVALLVARLDPKKQQEIADDVLTGGMKEPTDEESNSYEEGPLSVREVKDLLETKYWLKEGDAGELVEMVEERQEQQEKERRAKERAKKADDDFKRKQRAASKPKKAEKTLEEVKLEWKAKYANQILAASLAKVESKADHDAKLLRFLVATTCRGYDKNSKEVGITKAMSLQQKLDACAKVEARKLRRVAIILCLDYMNIEFRPDEAIRTIQPLAYLLGVDTNSIRTTIDEGFKAAAAKFEDKTAKKPDESAAKKPSKATKADPFKVATAGAKKTLAKAKKAIAKQKAAKK